MSGGSSGSSGSTTPQATPEQMLAIYNQYLPQTLSTVNGQNTGTATSLAGSAAAANPIYTASGLSQLNSLAPGYAAAGNNLTQEQAMGQAQLLSGAGGQTALEGAALNNLTNPVQAASNTQATNLLNAYSTNGLSPGEYASTERAMNQGNAGTGNLGLNNNTNTIANAMNFGGAFNSKLGALGTALNTAGTVAANQNAQINPVSVATNAGNTSGNFGLSTFNPTQANTNLTTPYSFASSFGNQLAGVSSASVSNNSSGSAQGGLCFFTTAACEYMGLPDNCVELQTLRTFRDRFVPKDIVEQYYKIAPNILKKIKEPELQYIWSVVNKCIDLINNQLYISALNNYQQMVKQLCLI